MTISMHPWVRLPVALLQMALGTALFTGHGVRLLPQQPARYRSPGFVSVALIFVLAGLFRHSLVRGMPLVSVALGLLVMSAALLVVFRLPVTADRMTLAMCASAGVDLLVGAALAVGVLNGDNNAVRLLVLVWELAATFWAIGVREANLRKWTAR